MSVQAKSGSAGAGMCDGSAPIVASGRSPSEVTTVAAITAIRAMGTPGFNRTTPRINATTATVTVMAGQSGLATQSAMAPIATATTC